MVQVNKNLRSLIAIALVSTTVIFGSSTTKIANAATTASTSNNYGLTDKTQGGAILHAWDWSFNTIKNNLKDIADAGYSSVQVSPIQGTKENSMASSYWWLLYQPTNFSIGNAQLGNRDEFKAMCDEADKYGIKIIVDVVANHTANRGGGINDQFWPASAVDPELKNNESCWHEHKGVSDWNDRWQVTHLGISLADLNTSNYTVQNKTIAFLNDCIDSGADGFRFDAAKHIELPDDPGGSDYWTRVLGSLKNKDKLFIYGEVLQGGADRFSAYSNYMGLAADHYGKTIRSAVGFNGNKSVSSIGDYSAAGVNADHLVTWVESHDTYAGDQNVSTSMNLWQIKMGWALIDARAYSTPLFFNRTPGSSKLQGTIGNVGNNDWKDPDVIAVNKFRNAMNGEGEYLRQQSNDVMMIERGTKGAVIVNLAGNTSLNSDTKLADGIYTNKATTGGTFTVSNGKITGNLSEGITVLYNIDNNPTISSSVEDSTFVDSLTLTLGTKNSTSATYSVNNGAATSYIDGQTIQIGKDAAIEDKIIVTLTAINGSKTATKTYTYTKIEQPVILSSKVYFYNTNNWSNPTAYIYNDSTTTVKTVAAWPGVAMIKGIDGVYSYTLPEGFGDAKVIFSNKGADQTPVQGQAGYTLTSGTSMEYNNGTWQSHKETVVEPSVSSSIEDSTFVDSLTLTLSAKNSTSATYSVSNGTVTSYTDGQTITLGNDAAIGSKLTVKLTATNGSKTATKTYTYTKIEQPVILSSKVYFYNTNNWSNPTAYIYNDSTTTVKTVTAWPGVSMIKGIDGVYSYTLPEGFGDAKVIFSNKGADQMPAQGQAGYTLTSGTSMEYNNGTWQKH